MIFRVDPSSREFFESLYRLNDDPWNFADDAYERSRYDAILEALGNRRFGRAFEPGCSVGVLTKRLAPRCDELLATDLSQTAVMHARKRCAGCPNVRIEQGSVADVDPGPVDLLLLSEIGYYFVASDLAMWAKRLLGNVQGGGVILAAHWLGRSPDHVLSGDQVHSILGDVAAHHNYALICSKRASKFRLDKWTRAQ